MSQLLTSRARFHFLEMAVESRGLYIRIYVYIIRFRLALFFGVGISISLADQRRADNLRPRYHCIQASRGGSRCSINPLTEVSLFMHASAERGATVCCWDQRLSVFLAASGVTRAG